MEKMVVPRRVNVATQCRAWSCERIPVQLAPCSRLVCSVLEERTGGPQWLGLEARPGMALKKPKQLQGREVPCSRSY